MLDVYETRRANLRALSRQWGGPTSLSRKLGHSNGSYLAQLIGPSPSRVVSEKVAREIEARLKLPLGWLDQQHGEPERLDDESLADCVRAVAGALRDAGLRPDPDKYSTLVALAFDHYRLTGRHDEPWLVKLVSLLR